MKIVVAVSVEDDNIYSFEGEVTDLYKKDILNTIRASIPQLSLKFGDSGNVVHVPLKLSPKA